MILGLLGQGGARCQSQSQRMRHFSVHRSVNRRPGHFRTRPCTSFPALAALRSSTTASSTSSPALPVPARKTGLPGDRLPSLRRALERREALIGNGSFLFPHHRPLRILETHSGLTGLVAEHATSDAGEEFDGMWSSSLTASASRAMPDIEAVDVSERLSTVRETLAVTTKPLVFDADTGGAGPDVFRFTVRALEQLGVSAAIIEDKAGLKQNSLFGTERTQTLADIDDFAAKLRAGVDAKRHPDFLVVARMESLIAGAGMDEAVRRAIASTDAGADGILIHSKRKGPYEVMEFAARYRAAMGESTASVPIFAVPSTYSGTTEKQLGEAGVDVCIYANQMLRAAYPAMLGVATSILGHSRSWEAELAGQLMPIKDIITLIDEAGLSNVSSPSSSSSSRMTNAASGSDPVDGFASGASAENMTTVCGLSKPSPSSGTAQYHICNGSTVLGTEKPARTKSIVRGFETGTAPSDSGACGDPIPETDSRLDPARIVQYIRNDLGIDFFSGVPDSCLKHFCAYLDLSDDGGDDVGRTLKIKHVIAPNEGASVALAIGHHLATGAMPLVYMQNSGLGNAINPLLSAAHPEVYGCPMVILVGWRGYPGGDPDEPQHRVAGRQTQELLHAAGVKSFVLPTEEEGATDVLRQAYDAARATKSPVAILAKPKTFQEVKPPASSLAARPLSAENLACREEAIAVVLDAIGPSDVVVATTGFTSRELFELREARGESHESDFLCVGSMGHAIAIAQGIALAQPNRKVWCLDGDGAALMHLGSFVSSPSLGLENLCHVLINNNAHESVGGQRTSVSQKSQSEASEQDIFSFAELAKASGYSFAHVSFTLRDFASQLAMAHRGRGPKFVEIKTRTGARDNLGRPKHSPGDAKDKFISFMKESLVEPSKQYGVQSSHRCSSADRILLTPGPLTTSRETKLAMMHDVGSRDPSFVKLTAQVREKLINIFPPTPESASLTAVLMQGSGTFAVEAMLSQFVKEKVVILSNGAYGRRMAAICKAHNLPHLLFESPEDAPLDPEEVRKFLGGEHARGATHVAVVACETTSGVLNPMSEISNAVASKGKKLLVDAMSSFGIVEIDPSTVRFAALAASSNKGLQGPPGIGFVICPKEGLEACADNADTLSLDLYDQWHAFENGGEWRFTPPTHCMLGLSQALSELEKEGGRAGRSARYTTNCEILVQGMRQLGFETLLPDETQAPVIVTFLLPEDPNFDFQSFYDLLSSRGFVIYPGKITSRPTFRIGCIGHVFPTDMRNFVLAVKEVMLEMGVNSGKPSRVSV